ncbi:Mov34/MPN/PAD-1 family protein [Methylobacterium sp. R2-1]|uniref:Mov34/MPN/PAD-1 family protein n=1 Tax=Methylobacterium sp. R2-1 TaxID=2587064 RepID=UPI00160AA5D7|nr:Mov34/MPN/PAD-1 family protein [Methylobacterium sp. R2-1]MBB2961932.1 integrative and conjugative element protein (TIGR02256 family) [Methylobacterium sp. R2-1]
MTTISLPPEQRAKLGRHLRRAGRREIGGILMGEQLEHDRFRIVEFTVDETSGTPAHFVRSPEHHRAALDAFFRRTGADYRRFNYLGEWHSHPSYPVLPSREDVASMVDLVTGERDIAFAVLLIIRLRCALRIEAGGFMFAMPGQMTSVTLTR